MRLPRLRRRWIAVAVVLVLLVTAVRLLDRASWIYYYRVIDDRTLIVGTITGPVAWTRITSVGETPSTVTITVSSIREGRMALRVAGGEPRSPHQPMAGRRR